MISSNSTRLVVLLSRFLFYLLISTYVFNVYVCADACMSRWRQLAEVGSLLPWVPRCQAWKQAPFSTWAISLAPKFWLIMNYLRHCAFELIQTAFMKAFCRIQDLTLWPITVRYSPLCTSEAAMASSSGFQAPSSRLFSCLLPCRLNK